MTSLVTCSCNVLHLVAVAAHPDGARDVAVHVEDARALLAYQTPGQEPRGRETGAGPSQRENPQIRLITWLFASGKDKSPTTPGSATGEPPGRSEASHKKCLPECQQPPVKARSKEAPGRPPMRGGRRMCWLHLFFHLFGLVSRLDAGRRFGLVTRTRVAGCGSRASSPHLRFFHNLTTRQRHSSFLRGRAVATAVAAARAASDGTQRASPVNDHMSTCQSDGADLSPANLSCPGVYRTHSAASPCSPPERQP